MQPTMALAPSGMHGAAHATDHTQTSPERSKGHNHIGHHKKICKTTVNSSLMGDAPGGRPAIFAPTRSLAGCSTEEEGLVCALERDDESTTAVGTRLTRQGDKSLLLMKQRPSVSNILMG